ncbi:MAG TPA: GntR family transcriptional regulator [Bacteroidales bacterium]|nr:GntR family transcriptional regulator [Bacteroidales bacterium]
MKNKFDMEFKDNKSIYLQIADLFCENILTKKWKENERIPSVREIAVALEVNPNTAMRSFLFMEEKGVIYNKRGIGYFVSDEGYKKTLVLRKEIFINNELPEFFKTLKLLKMSISDIKEYEKK